MNLVSAYRPLFPYLKKYRREYIAGFLCLIAVDAAQVVIPQLVARAVNLLQSRSFAVRDILFISLAIVAVMAVVASGRFAWRYFIHGASRRIEAELRDALFSHLLTLDSGFYGTQKIGDLMARATNDIGAVRNAAGWGFVAGVDGTVMAVGILVIIFVQNPGTAIFAVLPLPVITLVIILFGGLVGKKYGAVQESYSAMSDAVQETFAGSRVVKSFVKEAWFVKKFAATNDDYKAANMSLTKIQGAFFPLTGFLAGLTTLIVLLVGGRAVITGTMQPGSLVALLSYVQMLIWPMLGAGFTVNMIQRGAVSMRRISEIMETVPVIKNEGDCPPAAVTGLSAPICGANSASIPVASLSQPEIQLCNLSFSYGSSTPVLRNINLTVRQGEWLGIMGPTGSGKSTLLRLLPRLLEAGEGMVIVRGIEARKWRLADLRALFAFVPQDSFLFSDTIRANIAYGENEAGEDAAAVATAIAEAARCAGLERDMKESAGANPLAFDTLIGERGLSLSGGQKQRVAIARALLLDAPILVMDDALSACDAETEKSILTSLAAARKGKTTIIASHRVAAFRSCDTILVLGAASEGGSSSVGEYGTPAKLAEKSGGYYAKLKRLQTLE